METDFNYDDGDDTDNGDDDENGDDVDDNNGNVFNK